MKRAPSRGAPRLWFAVGVVTALLLLAVSGVHVGNDGTKSEGTALAAVPGRILFGHAGDIWIADGGAVFPLTNGGRYWYQPDASPDGSRLALISWGQSATDVYVMNTDGSEVRQLTNSQARRLQDNAWVFFPRWSPDGQSIAFISDRNSNYPMLWTMRTDGSGARQLTQARSNLDAVDSFSWSPDGSQIAATRFQLNTSQINVIDVARPANSRILTNIAGGSFDPSWSPDGQHIAFVARDGRRTLIEVLDITSNDPPTVLVTADSARSPRWSPNGSSIAYLALSGAEFELFVVDLFITPEGRLLAGQPIQLTSQFGVDATSGLTWVPG
ncbi:MAG: acylaminoacyl-peptidase [Chloroflexi bacterium]|nr:acylaminoacyl-peptidase [Chloroflexota bacterium]